MHLYVIGNDSINYIFIECGWEERRIGKIKGDGKEREIRSRGKHGRRAVGIEEKEGERRQVGVS